ncbi:MAG: helix-turn-helix domain-containing protein [Phycisphaerae bacterium]|nr:helix-turn-helix domain-containing protein [Phycisphaerae bacterium]
MTVRDVAETLQISRYTVERGVLAGDLRAIDVSGRRTGVGRRRAWRITSDSLAEFLERRASAPPRPVRCPKRRRLEGVIEFIK